MFLFLIFIEGPKKPLSRSLQYNASNFKLKLILGLFSISHKYRLESLQTFATQLLVLHSTHPNTTCRTPELEHILRLAIRNDAFLLTKVVEQALLRRLEDGDQTVSIARLITLAEELGMRKFQGILYYHELVREESSIIFKFPSSTAYNIPHTNLTEKQSLALFRGYRSLLRYWHQLPGAVREKKLSQLALCKDHHKCQSEWDSAWSVETIKKRDPFSHNLDILASLKTVQAPRPNTSNPIPFSFALNSKTPATSTPNPFFVTATPVVFPPNTQLLMRQCGQKELSDLIKQLKDTLADHFLGSQLPWAFMLIAIFCILNLPFKFLMYTFFPTLKLKTVHWKLDPSAMQNKIWNERT